MAAAAFYDLEGTLVSTNLVHTLAFYAKNQPGLFSSVRKSATTLLSLPVFAVTDQYSRKVFNDLFFQSYKGQTEDRMRFFAQERSSVLGGSRTVLMTEPHKLLHE